MEQKPNDELEAFHASKAAEIETATLKAKLMELEGREFRTRASTETLALREELSRRGQAKIAEEKQAAEAIAALPEFVDCGAVRLRRKPGTSNYELRLAGSRFRADLDVGRWGKNWSGMLRLMVDDRDQCLVVNTTGEPSPEGSAEALADVLADLGAWATHASRRFEHKEAFCLMLYRDIAGNEEWIWNSRDGVTPFGVRSRAGLDATHVDFHRDKRDPRHVPAVGDRIFVTMTTQRAKELATRWFESFSSHKDQNFREGFLQRYTNRDIAIANRALEILEEFFPSPDLVEVTEEMHERFARLNGASGSGGA